MIINANARIEFIQHPKPPPVLLPGEYKVPATGNFVRIRRDWQTIHWMVEGRGGVYYGAPRGAKIYQLKMNYATGLYEGMPAKNPYAIFPDAVPMPGMKPDDFAPLTEERQWFWFNLMSRITDDTWGFPELALAWLDITRDGRAMTDDRSWSNEESRNTDLTKMYREYITGKNLTTNSKDMAIKSLHMGGNLGKVLREEASYYIIEAIDFSPGVPPPPVDEVFDKPWLVGRLTQTGVNPVRALNWSQLDPFGVPFPVVGFNGENKLPQSWADPVANNTVLSWYK